MPSEKILNAPMNDLPPHNPLKLPFLCLTALIGLGVAVYGLSQTAWALVGLGVISFVPSLVLAWLVHRDRRYRWLKAPLDKRRPPL